MYCKYCGKELEEDSVYCRYCGSRLVELNENIPRKGNPILLRFRGLPKIQQYIILIYVLWFLLVFNYAITHINEENYMQDVLYWSIKYGVLIPLGAFFIIYVIYTPKNSKKIELQQGQRILAENKKDYKLIKVHMLTDFAHKKGKMQVVNAINEANQSITYCRFEKDKNITIVHFSDNIIQYSAREISEQKYRLCVKEFNDGKFKLAMLDNLSEEELKLLFH